MINRNQDDTFKDNLRQSLDNSTDNLGAETLSAITQARYRALESRKTSHDTWGWMPAGAVAGVCMALLVYVSVSHKTVEESPVVDELELLSNIDDIELLEDLEFYEWLEDYELPT